MIVNDQLLPDDSRAKRLSGLNTSIPKRVASGNTGMMETFSTTQWVFVRGHLTTTVGRCEETFPPKCALRQQSTPEDLKEASESSHC